MSNEPNFIASLSAESEIEAPAAQAEPTLGSAYFERNNSGVEETTPAQRRAERQQQRNATLAEEAESASRTQDYEREGKPKRAETSLSDAYEGVTADPDLDVEEEPVELERLPESLRRFDPELVAGVMLRLGLSEEDLDEGWISVLEQQCAAEEAQEGKEEGQEEDEEQKDEEAEKPKEEEKQRPNFVAMSPPELQQIISDRWDRSQDPAVNHPQLHAEFSAVLSNLLSQPVSTEEERVERVDQVTKLMEFGAQSLIESIVPNQIQEYMTANYKAIVQAGIEEALEAHLPGLKEMHNEAAAANTWDKIRAENDNFADLPDFESKEFCELRDKIRQAAPWIDSWDPDPSMAPMAALAEKARLFARLAVGERVDKKAILQQTSDAIEQGKRAAEKSNRRVSASSTAGRAGRTTGSIGAEDSDRESLLSAFYSRNSPGGI